MKKRYELVPSQSTDSVRDETFRVEQWEREKKEKGKNGRDERQSRKGGKVVTDILMSSCGWRHKKITMLVLTISR